MLEVLRSFAADNGGSFPAGQEPLQALTKIYPKYLVDPNPLAGLSGDRRLLKRELSTGSKISPQACSWVYWPGLRIDDSPEIALIWESRSGLRFNGTRAEGHEVGFVDGSMRQVPDAAWASFVAEQKHLREKVLRSRETKGN